MQTKIEDIDFKALAKECKTQEDLAGLTKQFMKNMIEGMLQAELEEHQEEILKRFVWDLEALVMRRL